METIVADIAIVQALQRSETIEALVEQRRRTTMRTDFAEQEHKSPHNVVTHYINTTLDSDNKTLKPTADRYIGIGYFNYLALQQHGTVSMRVDNSSAAQARKNLTTFVFNSAFSATDLSTKLNKKGGTTTQAFSLYKLTAPTV